MEISKARLTSEQFMSMLLPLLEEKRDVEITVAGNSMFPLWKHGRDRVTLTCCDKDTLRKGDIPLYRRHTGQLVLHRIVRVSKCGYDMCGDGQDRVERHVPKDNVIAVVKSFTRKNKTYSCEYVPYRVFVSLWLTLLPFRSFALRSIRAWRIWIL